VRVLKDATVADFHETKDALDHVESMLDPGTNASVGAVNLLLSFGEAFAACRVRVREIRRGGCPQPDRSRLTAIRGVAPDACFVSMEQFGQNVTIMNVGRRCRERMNDPVLTVHADVRFHPEMPLIALHRLMHFRIALSAI
jgi:hypothetical protein